MPFVFFGFVSIMLVWLFFAMVWAAALLFWPVTLLIAGVVIWRAKRRTVERWQAAEARASRHEVPRSAGTSRHSAFDEYRQETLHRLDEEQGKFREFLEKLRKSRDRKDFEAFMAARRTRPAIVEGSAAAG